MFVENRFQQKSATPLGSNINIIPKFSKPRLPCKGLCDWRAGCNSSGIKKTHAINFHLLLVVGNIGQLYSLLAISRYTVACLVSVELSRKIVTFVNREPILLSCDLARYFFKNSCPFFCCSEKCHYAFN